MCYSLLLFALYRLPSSITYALAVQEAKFLISTLPHSYPSPHDANTLPFPLALDLLSDINTVSQSRRPRGIARLCITTAEVYCFTFH
jgi:hypothetical protein